MDPCAGVRASCAAVMAYAGPPISVSIDAAALATFATSLAKRTRGELPLWDSSGWHYDDDVGRGGALTAQYVLVLDALNWCFWPSTSAMQYDGLASGLTAVMRARPEALSTAALCVMRGDTLAAWFLPHDLPCAEERAAHLRSVGAVLSAQFGGSALALIAAAKGSAVALVRLVNAHFPTFRDEAVHRGRHIQFYKRSQIFVADVWAAFGRRQAGAAYAPGAFSDIAELTCFADYRLPQLLAAEGVLVYAPALAARVAAKEELPAGGPDEVEIRAATVVAVEALRAQLEALRGEGGGDASAAMEGVVESDDMEGVVKAAGAAPVVVTPVAASGSDDMEGVVGTTQHAVAATTGGAPRPLNSVEVDWYLWQFGEAVKDTIAPHHRTLTVFY